MDLSTPPEPEAAPPVRRPWFKREPLDVGGLLVETLAVLVGVLLALGIDSWRKERDDAKTVQVAMEAIGDELETNAAAARRHATRVTQAASAMAARNRQDDAGRACTAYAGWGGAEVPMFTQTAYEVAVATQALAKMPFTQANVIGRAYGAQRHVQMMHDKATDILLDPAPKPLATCIGIYREMAQASAGIGKLDSDVAASLGKRRTQPEMDAP